MKKDRVYTRLDYSNGIEQVLLNNGKDSMSSEKLLKLLRDGVKTKELVAGKKIQSDKLTKYVFDAKSYDEDKGKYIKGSIVVEVKNSEKKYVARTVGSLDDICTITVQIKKVNRARLIAGISAGLVLLTTAGPTIARKLNDRIKISLEYDSRASIEAYKEYMSHRQPTEEETKQSIDEYYKDLEQRAKAGDESAIKEYSEYLVEQQLIEQRKSELKTR